MTGFADGVDDSTGRGGGISLVLGMLDGGGGGGKSGGGGIDGGGGGGRSGGGGPDDGDLSGSFSMTVANLAEIHPRSRDI
jgi:hypothetical protein